MPRSLVVCAALVLLCASLAVVTEQRTPAAQAVSAIHTEQGYQPDPDGERALQNGDYSRAADAFQRALGSGVKGGAAECYLRIGLGESLLWQGKLDAANKEFKRAESLERKLSDAKLSARLYDDIAWMYQGERDYNRALIFAERSLDIRQKLGEQAGFDLIMSLVHTAYIADQVGENARAIQLYKQALNYPLGDAARMFTADIQDKLASVLWETGDAQQAQQLYETSLQSKMDMNAVSASYSPHPYWQNVCFRFHQGAPNCSIQTHNRVPNEETWANGVTVAVSAPTPAEANKLMRLDIAIKNDSDLPVQFLSQPPTLVDLSPRVRMIQMVDPESLANDVEKKGERKAKWIRFWGQDATMPVTSTFIGSPGVWGYPGFVSYNGTMPVVNRSGNMTTVTTQVPDYAAQQRALEKAAAAIEQSRNSADTIRARAIGPTTVQPGQVVRGSLYFDTKEIKEALVQLPVGNAYFEYRFPVK